MARKTVKRCYVLLNPITTARSTGRSLLELHGLGAEETQEQQQV
jgi:hypothetical protein